MDVAARQSNLVARSKGFPEYSGKETEGGSVDFASLSDRPKLQSPKKSFKHSKSVRTSIGVEIGYNAIYLTRLREAPDGVVILDDFRTVTYDPLLDLRSTAFVNVIKTALKDFCGSARKAAIWAAPKQDRARLHHVQIPRMNPSRISGAVYWALQREESFLEKETVVDFVLDEDAVDSAEPNLGLTGVLAAREDIESLKQTFVQAGYPLTGITLPLFALRNHVRRHSSLTPETPVLICQMGLQATSVSVLLGQRLVFTRSIPVGLRSLAETLVKELDPAPSQVQAANLVLALGREGEESPSNEPWRAEEVFQALRPSLGRMVRQTERTLQYFQSNYNSDPIETIFMGGEIAARGRLFAFISEELSANVIAIDPFELAERQGINPTPASPAERVAYGPASGLALATDDTPNLARTYKDRQKELKHRRVATMVFGFLFAMSAASGILYGWQQTQLRSLHAERDALELSLEALGPRITEGVILDSMEDVRALQERRRAAAKRYEGLALLSEVTRLTPAHISLVRIAAEMGSPIKSNAENRQLVVLEGVVNGERTSLETSLTIYLARLNQSPLFHAVEVNSARLVETAEGLCLAFTLGLEAENKRSEALAKR